tara:strand:- start:6454 stop:6771 length:318 start_codon:yes stop_codon:yes gene_type:complete
MENLENAHSLLEENITSLTTVTEWGKVCGFDCRKKFSRAYREYFGLRPKETLYEIRIQKIKEYMKTFPNEINYCVAVEFGFTNEQGLYKFIKRHTGLSPTQLRKG